MVSELFKVHKTKADHHSGTKQIMAQGWMTTFLTTGCVRGKSPSMDTKAHMPHGS